MAACCLALAQQRKRACRVQQVSGVALFAFCVLAPDKHAREQCHHVQRPQALAAECGCGSGPRTGAESSGSGGTALETHQTNPSNPKPHKCSDTSSSVLRVFDHDERRFLFHMPLGVAYENVGSRPLLHQLLATLAEIWTWEPRHFQITICIWAKKLALPVVGVAVLVLTQRRCVDIERLLCKTCCCIEASPWNTTCKVTEHAWATAGFAACCLHPRKMVLNELSAAGINFLSCHNSSRQLLKAGFHFRLQCMCIYLS